LYQNWQEKEQIDQFVLLAYEQIDPYPLSGQVAFCYCGEIIQSLLIAVVREMPSVKAPQYSKTTHLSTNAVEPCYTFAIEYTESEEKIDFVAEHPSLLLLESLPAIVSEHQTWWNQFLQAFLQSSSKLFSKPYSILQINKIAKHTLNGVPPSIFPVHVTVYPTTIQIRGGVFWVNWNYVTEPMVIDIPDLAESTDTVHESSPLPVLNQMIRGVEEVNLDDLPVEKNATEEALTLDPPTKFYDRQKAKEARLKAKIAIYRAQHQMTKYYEKYGTELSDSDTETESEDESESEEVQL
jgi:hypothetical protein